ncbi:2'-5' RNA ligase family protein [Leptodesmis sp.]|uniref:2'-5' RNA ligase family protein n=1 Tax=Leptodesmis sp. TaxID=3100501 RepID=UPI0040535A95
MAIDGTDSQSMNTGKKRFFIALLPSREIQDYANEIKQYFSDRYNSRAAQKSPPHITLQPPFEWPVENLPQLEQHLSIFALAQSPFSVTLQGFAAFPPRVIYINVLKTAELLHLQQALLADLEANLGIVNPKDKTRPFAPHITVASRDLTQQAFKAAWPEFQGRSLHFSWLASSLTLLSHNGQRWTICQEFPFSPPEKP